MLVISFPDLESYLKSQDKYSVYIKKQIRKYKYILYIFDEPSDDVLRYERLIRGRISTYIHILLPHDLEQEMLVDNIVFVYETPKDDCQRVRHEKSEHLPTVDDLLFYDQAYSNSRIDYFLKCKNDFHKQIEKFKGHDMHVVNGKLMQSYQVLKLLQKRIDLLESFTS